jgi:hypothetical protein
MQKKDNSITIAWKNGVLVLYLPLLVRWLIIHASLLALYAAVKKTPA